MRFRHPAPIAALVAVHFGSHYASVQAQQTAPPALVGAGTLQWQTSLEEARRIASETNRLVLVHFWSPNYAQCAQLEQTVFSQPNVQQAISARFVPLKLNADEFPTTAKEHGITRLPSEVLITPGGQVVGRMVCPMSADIYLQQLAICASGTGPGASPAGAAYVAAPTTAPTANAAIPAVQPTQATSQLPVAAAPNYAAANNAAGPRYGELPQTAAAAASPPPAVKPAAPPALAAYSEGRYAEYFQRFGQGSAGAPAANQPAATNSAAMVNTPAAAATPPAVQMPIAAMQPAPAGAPYETMTNPYAAGPRYGAVQPQSQPPATAAYAPPVAQAQPTYAPPAVNTGIQTSSAGVAQNQFAAPNISPGVAAAAPQMQSGEPPLGLEGFSPVTVVDQDRWVPGDRRWGVVHRGRTYLFSAPEEQQKFLANPDRYSPALSGRDVVVALDYGQEIEGKRQFGVKYQDKMYLFSNEASRRQFSQNMARYVTPILQAESPSQTVRR